MDDTRFIDLSISLSDAGLVWNPAIGDEVAPKPDLSIISILVDPQGRTPSQLRNEFLWLPTLEQLIMQFEARQAVIFHAGVGKNFKYQTVVQTDRGVIESEDINLRLAFGVALKKLLVESYVTNKH